MATKIPRMGITVSPELKEWFEQQAKTMGISASALVTVAMMNYKMQQDAMTRMKDMPALIEEIKKLQVNQLELENQK